MEQKLYKVKIDKNCHLFVIAYSEEHAIVEVVNMNRSANIEDYPSEYSLSEVCELSKDEMEDIIIDFIYPTKDEESDTLLNIFEGFTEKEGFFGVIGDDFIAY